MQANERGSMTGVWSGWPGGEHVLEVEAGLRKEEGGKLRLLPGLAGGVRWRGLQRGCSVAPDGV